MLRIRQLGNPGVRIVRRSVDARKKPNVRIIYTIDVTVDGSEKNNSETKRLQAGIHRPGDTVRSRPPPPKRRKNARWWWVSVPVECLPPWFWRRPAFEAFGPGTGPGCRVPPPSWWRNSGRPAVLDPRCNVQFGEGGAGTFSDGKLNTGTHDPRNQLGPGAVRGPAAAPREQILYDAKPHMGTDVLLTVVQNLRKRIDLSGRRGAVSARRLTDLCTPRTDASTGLSLEKLGRRDGHPLPTGRCWPSATAPGTPLPCWTLPRRSHGAEALRHGRAHRATAAGHRHWPSTAAKIPPCPRRITSWWSIWTGETVYTFCMCPGGYVVAAASEEGRVVTNGMSYADRDGENANAALLVTVNPTDFPYEGNLGGMRWQREIEENAYHVSGSYRAPAQRVGDFLAGRPSDRPGRVTPTYRPGVTWCDLHDVLPGKITDAIAQALPRLDGKLKGFADPDAVMTAPETRSSSPVRIIRDSSRQSSLRGLYPTGRGRGLRRGHHVRGYRRHYDGGDNHYGGKL